jgi:hypothetical protein
MRRVVLGIGALVVVTLAAFSLPASATHTGQTDPNDTAGRLDVKTVRFEHDASPVRWRIATFGTWTVEQIWDTGFVIVELDTRGDARPDHLVVVRSNGRTLLATLFRVRKDGTQKELGALTAGKDGSRAATVSVALHKLSIGANRTSYSWAVVTSFDGPACPRTCLDRAPDLGMIEQPLPGVTPTPTPTATPSPTPTPTPTP